jgi:hypothetical protein
VCRDSKQLMHILAGILLGIYKIVVLLFHFFVLIFRFMNPRVLLAFDVILEMCVL